MATYELILVVALTSYQTDRPADFYAESGLWFSQMRATTVVAMADIEVFEVYEVNNLFKNPLDFSRNAQYIIDWSDACRNMPLMSIYGQSLPDIEETRLSLELISNLRTRLQQQFDLSPVIRRDEIGSVLFDLEWRHEVWSAINQINHSHCISSKRRMLTDLANAIGLENLWLGNFPNPIDINSIPPQR